MKLGLVMSFMATSCQPAFGDSGSDSNHFWCKNIFQQKYKYLANAE